MFPYILWGIIYICIGLIIHGFTQLSDRAPRRWDYVDYIFILLWPLDIILFLIYRRKHK